MNNKINSILIPVQLNDSHLSVVKQVAELAREHEAEIHLLNIIDPSFAINHSILARNTPSKSYHLIAREKMALLSTWNRWLEQKYMVKVRAAVELGDWKKTVLAYAAQFGADMIVLNGNDHKKRTFSFFNSPIEYIIKKSKCQVITIFKTKSSMEEWKQVVIPVTDFLPEIRIQTILESAKEYNIKIHFVAFSGHKKQNTPNSFNLLTETLKRLKSVANIQVECKYIKHDLNQVRNMFGYVNLVGADALMTNRKNNNELSGSFREKLTEFFDNTDYGKYPEAVFAY